MGFSEIFGGASSAIVRLFSKELGACTFRHRSDSSFYVADTGEVQSNFVDYHPVFITLDDIKDLNDVPIGITKEHSVAYISGNDLPVVPNKGDSIVDQVSNTYSIDGVTTDQYHALYTVYIKRSNATDEY